MKEAKDIILDTGIVPREQSIRHLMYVFCCGRDAMTYLGIEQVLTNYMKSLEEIENMEAALLNEKIAAGRVSSMRAYEIMRPLCGMQNDDRLMRLLLLKSNFFWSKVNFNEYMKVMYTE
jgi:hypothetical protein